MQEAVCGAPLTLRGPFFGEFEESRVQESRGSGVIGVQESRGLGVRPFWEFRSLGV